MRYRCLGLILAVQAGCLCAQSSRGPATVEFEGVSSAAKNARDGQQLSYKLDAADRMTIDVRVGAAGPYDFLIDTGADRTVVSRALAGRLNLDRSAPAVLHSVTGTQPVQMASIDSLHFSAKTMRNVRAAVLEGPHIGADGILGIDSLRSERVTFDFRKGTMTIVPSSVRQERLQRDEVVVRGKLRSGRLVLTEGRSAGRRTSVVVDTGADISIGNLALYRVHRRSGYLRSLGRVQMQSVTGETLSGEMMSLERFELGGIIVRNLNLVFADAHTFRTLNLDKRPALLMGMNMLQAFEKVSIDFANRKFRVLVPQESSLRPLLMASR